MTEVAIAAAPRDGARLAWTLLADARDRGRRRPRLASEPSRQPPDLHGTTSCAYDPRASDVAETPEAPSDAWTDQVLARAANYATALRVLAIVVLMVFTPG